MIFRIYYAGGPIIEGRTRADWVAAPDDGVQVVVRFPPLHPMRWSWSGGAVRDRDLWTGTDDFDPFGFGLPKRGLLIDTRDYLAIWEAACGDQHP